jgi:hypothetical protein
MEKKPAKIGALPPVGIACSNAVHRLAPHRIFDVIQGQRQQ